MQIYFTSLNALIPVILIWLRICILFKRKLVKNFLFLKSITPEKFTKKWISSFCIFCKLERYWCVTVLLFKLGNLQGKLEKHCYMGF